MQSLLPLALAALTLGQAHQMLRHGPRGRLVLRVSEPDTETDAHPEPAPSAAAG